MMHKKNSVVQFVIHAVLIFNIYSCASKMQAARVMHTEDEVEVLNSSEKNHQKPTFLLGKWYGEVMTNSSDPLGGGKPTLGETGTELYIHLFESDASITGSLSIGQVEEQWLFKNEQHIWSDGQIKVHTQAIRIENIPNWIKDRLLNTQYDEILMYQFLSCNKLSNKKPCEVKKDLPQGIIDNGVWVFMTQGSNLYVNVYYTYPSGGRRILEQKLSKR